MKKLIATLSLVLAICFAVVGLSACKKSSSPVGVYKFSKVEFVGEDIKAKIKWEGDNNFITAEKALEEYNDMYNVEQTIELKADKTFVWSYTNNGETVSTTGTWRQVDNKILMKTVDEEYDYSIINVMDFDGKTLSDYYFDDEDANSAFKIVYKK